MTIPIAKPDLTSQDANAVRDVILSGWVTQGPQVEKFEAEFAAAVGAQYACAVTSGTTAIQLALTALDISRGDEVITASHSFIAVANMIRMSGATPVFVDIDPDTFNIEPEAIVQAISPRTRAIVCVHQMGMPCDLSAIVEIGRRYNIAIIEDAACAAGSEINFEEKWQPIGKPHGDIACFSFHPRKVITAGEGGMLTTANRDWHQRFKLLRHHGMNVSDLARHNSRVPILEKYVSIGSNFRMTDMQAALGRQQVTRLAEIVERRRALAERYGELLRDLEHVRTPREPAWARSNWQSYCVRLSEGIEQRRTMKKMLEAGVSTRRGIMCAHREPAYADVPCPHELRQSEQAQDHCILLPLYPQMTVAEQDAVVAALAAACDGCRR